MGGVGRSSLAGARAAAPHLLLLVAAATTVLVPVALHCNQFGRLGGV
jgi:hypothetical protein